VAQHHGIALDAARGRGFGSNALKADGRIFAALSNGRLLVKLPARRVEELIAAGLGKPFSTGPRPDQERMGDIDAIERRRMDARVGRGPALCARTTSLANPEAPGALDRAPIRSLERLTCVNPRLNSKCSIST
jgi:hypothetical protein